MKKIIIQLDKRISIVKYQQDDVSWDSLVAWIYFLFVWYGLLYIGQLLADSFLNLKKTFS